MAYYQYHPKSTFKFGYVLDPRHPDDDKSTNGFYEWQDNKISDSNLGADVEFTVEEVTSTFELFEKLSIDLNIEAKFTFGSGKASFGWEREVDFSSSSIVYVAQGKKTYYEETYNGYLGFSERGRQAWEKACASNKIVDFQRIAGTEIVTRVRRGSFVSLIYVFNCSSEDVKERVRAKLEADWVGGSASVDFKSELSTLDKKISVKVTGMQSGVNNTLPLDARLSQIIAVNPGDLPAVKGIIANILGHISREDRDNSPIVGLNTASVSDLAEIGLSDYSDEFRKAIELNQIVDRNIIKLREYAIDNQRALEIAQKINTGWNTFDFTDESEQLISNNIEKLDENSTLIFENYSKCINARSIEETIVKSFEIPRLELTKIVRTPYIIPIRWAETTDIWCTGRTGTVLSCFFPLVLFRRAAPIKSLSVFRNNERIYTLTNDEIDQLIKDNGSFQHVWSSRQQSNGISNGMMSVIGCRFETLDPERKRFLDIHREMENVNLYKIEVTNTDGETHDVELQNPTRPIEINRSVFHVLSDDEVEVLAIERDSQVKIV